MGPSSRVLPEGTLRAGNARPHSTTGSQIFKSDLLFMSDLRKPGKKLNRADLADFFGVTLPTIEAWVRKGCPFIEKGGKGKGWVFSSSAVIHWRITTSVEEALSGYQDESGNITKDEADRRRAIANAITAEVAADDALKVVVHRHESEADVAAFCQAVKTGLSNAGSKIASRAAKMNNPAEIQDLCQSEINRAFSSAQAELIERWSGERHGDDDIGEDQPSP
jgi:phage terminase Nu1 subunit (DNA packaging protein)